MKQIRVYFCCILYLAICLVGCSHKTPDEPSALEVVSGSTTITYTVGKNEWNRCKYDREDTFKVLAKENNEFEYFHLGDTIVIKFLDSAPDTIELYDYILNSDGTLKYTTAATEPLNVELKDKKIEFELPANIAAVLSSNSKDYEPGATIRGFRLICTWGSNECEYAFIIRTDAK